MVKILIENKVIDPREKWIRKYIGIPELTPEEIDEIKKADEEKIEPKEEPTEEPEDQEEFKKKKPFVNFKQIEEQYDTYEKEFIREYSYIYMDNVVYLTNQVKRKKIIEEKNEKLVGTLRIKKTELRKLLQNYYAKMYFTGKIDAIKEIEGRLKKIKRFKKYVEMQLTEPWIDRQWVNSILEEYGALGTLTKEDLIYLTQMRERAFFITGVTENDMLEVVGNTIHEGLRNGKIGKDIILNIEANLTGKLQKYARTIARTNASDFYNTGRMNLFTSPQVSPFVEAYQYMAIIDQDTTLFCESHDGQIIPKDSPQLSYIVPPNHFNCRSMLVSILLGESEDPENPYYQYEEKIPAWGTDVPQKASEPAKGFGG
jgi:SPP1 gp7 family putative phage head morphogenesis protein